MQTHDYLVKYVTSYKDKSYTHLNIYKQQKYTFDNTSSFCSKNYLLLKWHTVNSTFTIDTSELK